MTGADGSLIFICIGLVIGFTCGLLLGFTIARRD